MKKLSRRHKNSIRSSGFTILELIVVIVIIGILASVMIATYIGTVPSSRDVSVQSDIDTMDALQTNYGTKNSVAGKAYYSPSGYDASLEFRPSGGNILDVVINSTDYCIRGYNTGGTKNSIWNAFTKESSAGVCAQLGPSTTAIAASSNAPLSPVADWLSVTQGDHYGNFFNLVGNNWATVTRASTKTIFDPSTQKIYDVPANYLGINPRSDGNNGNEATIESSSTNYVLQSSFENTMSGWNYQYVANGSAMSSSEKSVYGSYSLKITRTQAVTEANVFNSLSGLTPSTTYSYSVYAWASQPNSACIFTFLATTDTPRTCHSGDSTWQRLTGTFVSSATGTVQLRLGDTGPGPIASAYYDAVQVQAGSYTSSYIPTTTSAGNRSADIVTTPGTVSSFNAGTVFAVLAKPVTTNRGIYTFGVDSSNNIALYAPTTAAIQARMLIAGVSTYSASKSGLTTYNTAAWRWGPSGINTSVNSVIGTWGAITLPAGSPTTTYLGALYGSAQLGAPIQRFVVYSSALSDSDVTAVINDIKDGP